MKAYHIEITGIVQGVGFRPFVYRLAREHGLAGYVANSDQGVLIEVEGSDEALERFLAALRAEAPPQSVIDGLIVAEAEAKGYSRFEIRQSRTGPGAVRISPDIAVCEECLAEMDDPRDRRYRYPFINCTNCGPRLSIIKDTPYDRPLTTMSHFHMCPECRRQYLDPSDRRFHAQPIACPECGPRVWCCDRRGEELAQGQPAIEMVARHISRGGLAAVKGLGGFHIACDAENPEAVKSLRERKARPHKPLALMVGDMEEARRLARISPGEERWLKSPQAPIVLCRQAGDWPGAETAAPGNRYIGIMLAYTPLHHLLFRALHRIAGARVLVMTSGNVQDRPIIKDNQQALEDLGGIVDIFLLHDRDIENRSDDSIVMQIERRQTEDSFGDVQIIRHARGYAPNPVRLPKAVGPGLAVGGEMKNTFCLAQGQTAYLSQHIGEADNLETMEFFEEMHERYRRWFKIWPQWVAHDLHPDYLTTRWARDQSGVELVAVPHHYAHMMSVLADNQYLDQAIGVIYDGTGYGLDGRIWGGEFLYYDGIGYIQRMGHLEYLPMPGGEAAIRNPWRLAAAYSLVLSGRVEQRFFSAVPPREWEAVIKQTEARVNLVWTSSLGRLFDAVSALCGICRRITFEAQAAMALETAAAEDEAGSYDYEMEEQGDGGQVLLGPLWQGLEQDLTKGLAVDLVAAKFQNTVVDFTLGMCDNIKLKTGCRTVALSGGVFQNRYLLERIVSRLEEGGYRVLINRQVPANDGGLALGQVLYTALRA